MELKVLCVALLLFVSACAGVSRGSGVSGGAPVVGSSVTVASTPVEDTGAPLLRDGPVVPGRYRFVLSNECAADDPVACPPNTVPPPPMGIEVTVPDGWEAANVYHLLTPVASGTSGPDGGALVLGWTNFWVGLNSDPCLSEGHEIPDVRVGPGVDDFVDAVQAHKGLDVTKPSAVDVGGHAGRFFTLRAPSDISGCDNWRPWDPGFYAQGPDNIWDVWVIDVDGFRVLIVTDYFPQTPAEVRSQLRSMVQSIEFRP